MNKTVVITGVSRGLGLVMSNIFFGYGWHVVGTGRSERPAELPEEIGYHQFDAGDPVAAETFWKQIAGQYTEARMCLVNNAGGYVSGGLVETTPEQYESQMRSLYFTAVYMTRGLAMSFERARILNIISSSALRPHKNNSAYGAAKAAEMHFFQSLQEEFPAEKYQITNLYPKSIASHGPEANAMAPEDLATFVLEQAENERSYYVRDVTLWPRKT